MITIKRSDMSDLFSYIKWTIDNPSPCTKCYSYGTPECCGCSPDSEYREKKNSLPGASVYNNMNYQKLADAYGRRYIAEKAKEAAVEEYHKQCESFDDVKWDYTIVDDSLSIKPGDIIESIPHDIVKCPEVQLSVLMREYCGYHLKHDISTKTYYAFKELFDLNDPEYPNRFKYLGSFDKLETAHRALLEDRSTSSKFSIE